jgi:phosphohistidine phosphatase
MRHGKAENSSGQSDHERALAERGQSQARLVGEYLASQNVQVSRVLVSDSTRTVQTWDAVRSQMPDFDGEVTLHEDIYAGGPAEVLARVRGVAAEHPVVLVIGHEPTISSVTAALADDDSDAGAAAQARIGMPTGAMAVLSGSLPDWERLGEDSLTLHTIVRP